MNSSHPPSRLLARAPPQPSLPATSAAPSPFRLRSAEQAGAARQDGVQSPVPTVSFLVVNPAFLPDSAYPGNVRLDVEGISLYAHRDILIFASPFFETLLTGQWRETASETSTWPGDRASIRRDSMILSATLPQSGPSPLETPLTSSPSEPDVEGGVLLSPEASEVPSVFLSPSEENMESATMGSFVEALEDAQVEVDFEYEGRTRTAGPKIEARIRLVEDKAFAVQDLLAFIYPHLECNVSWANVDQLLHMSKKFLMPLLTRRCIDFLMTSAAGKPIMAVKLAEDYHIPELYKEASRFLLDNFAHWQPNELAILSPETLLKVERRRTYFLERLLKLGLVDPARDYTCAVSCPNPQVCARFVADKWQSAWNAAFRFGSPQPSIIFRSLRQLEPSLSSPALHLPHTSCQNHARAWVADLWDRMFIGAGPGSIRPVSGAFGSAANAARTNFAGQKYFLSVTLD